MAEPRLVLEGHDVEPLRVYHGVRVPPRRRHSSKGFMAALRELKRKGDAVLLPRGWKGTYTLIANAGLTGIVECRKVSGGIFVVRTK